MVFVFLVGRRESKMKPSIAFRFDCNSLLRKLLHIGGGAVSFAPFEISKIYVPCRNCAVKSPAELRP